MSFRSSSFRFKINWIFIVMRCFTAIGYEGKTFASEFQKLSLLWEIVQRMRIYDLSTIPVPSNSPTELYSKFNLVLLTTLHILR